MVQHFAKNAQQSDNESRLLYELGLYLENCGLSEPVNQVCYKGSNFLKKDKKFMTFSCFTDLHACQTLAQIN